MKRKEPLKRSTTPIRRTPLKRSTTPIPKVGPVKASKIGYQRQEREAVVERCSTKFVNSPSCEWHQNHTGTDWHHVFGRTIYGIGYESSEPWASSRDLTTMLCHELHMEITDGKAPRIQRHLESVAVQRLCATLRVPLSVIQGIVTELDGDTRPINFLRRVILWAVENDKHLPYAPEK